MYILTVEVTAHMVLNLENILATTGYLLKHDFVCVGWRILLLAIVTI